MLMALYPQTEYHGNVSDKYINEELHFGPMETIRGTSVLLVLFYFYISVELQDISGGKVVTSCTTILSCYFSRSLIILN